MRYAKKNTFNNSNSLIKEVKILCIHGILHLQGYSHASDDEADFQMSVERK